VTQRLLESGEPWTRYRVLVDLMDRSEDDAEVKQARADMLAHPQVKQLMATAATWGNLPFKRHNDAGYAIYALSTLADFGVRASDRGMAAAVKAVMAHRSSEGAFQSLINIPAAFGGTGQDIWTWIVCDAPTLLYVLLAMGRGQDRRVKQAVEHLAALVDDNGWRCVAAPEVGKFRGPGRKADPCPIANVYALKALAQAPALGDSAAAQAGVEMLLAHWEHRAERKFYLFGVGTDFCKLKYPFVWYDILHATDVLSRFPVACRDARFREMVRTMTAQADAQGRYTAGSMYQSWKGWSFADKRNASPWLTFLVMRILKLASSSQA
jgi:hypothetical protein